MTLRGVAMRTISIGANLLLLLLVSPAELGLFAVARGTLALLQYVAELGIGKALLRRREAPTDAEYAALSGLQIIVGVLVTLVGVVFPAAILGFGAIDARWHGAMVLTVATMLSLAFGTGARVRLERGLAYERLAIIDVFNVLTLNLGLVVFAALGRFSIGVFVLLGVASVAANVLLWVWAPGPRPSFDLRPLGGVARQSVGFLVASASAVAREQGTAVLVGALFGLPAAGLYSFAERVAQVLNITFEGFRNACIPAAARLVGDVQSLRALATRTLAGSSTLTTPAALLAICALPLLPMAVPRWSDAVVLTQWYVVAYALYGVVAATLEPVAIASTGARAAIAQQASALFAGWVTMVAVQPLGVAWIGVAVMAMYLAPIVALRVVTPHAIRPTLTKDMKRLLLACAVSLGTFIALRAGGAPVMVSAIAPPLLLLALAPQLRALPAGVWAALPATRGRACRVRRPTYSARATGHARPGCDRSHRAFAP
jgi:O-antigen/teichoic acid export membrane protein